jgi:hypothetical protein
VCFGVPVSADTYTEMVQCPMIDPNGLYLSMYNGLDDTIYARWVASDNWVDNPYARFPGTCVSLIPNTYRIGHVFSVPSYNKTWIRVDKRKMHPVFVGQTFYLAPIGKTIGPHEYITGWTLEWLVQ